MLNQQFHWWYPLPRPVITNGNLRSSNSARRPPNITEYDTPIESWTELFKKNPITVPHTCRSFSRMCKYVTYAYACIPLLCRITMAPIILHHTLLFFFYLAGVPLLLIALASLPPRSVAVSKTHLYQRHRNAPLRKPKPKPFLVCM